MIELSKAIKTRYDAKLLNTSVGKFYQGRSSTKATMPYTIYQEVSSTIISRTRSGKYTMVLVQWDVFTEDGDPETASDGLEAILALMEFGERASANALSVSGMKVLHSQVLSPPRVEEEGFDQVYRATAQQQFLVWEELNRTPA